MFNHELCLSRSSQVQPQKAVAAVHLPGLHLQMASAAAEVSHLEQMSFQKAAGHVNVVGFVGFSPVFRKNLQIFYPKRYSVLT